MLVVEKRCKICKAVKANKRLLERIYNSSYFVPHSKDNLLAISKEYKLSYEGILNHTKKHQFISSQDYSEKMLEHVDKKAEQKAVARAVKAADSIQSVIEKGQSRLDEGEITVNTDQLIRASQIKMAAEAKEKDQAIALQASLAHFISGESTSERVYRETEIIDADTS